MRVLGIAVPVGILCVAVTGFLYATDHEAGYHDHGPTLIAGVVTWVMMTWFIASGMKD